MMSKKAAIAIIHNTHRPWFVYALKRSDTCEHYSNMYCFPGGMVEEGETFQQACIREVKEETGLDLVPRFMTHIETIMMGDVETQVFRCWGVEATEVALSSEHSSWCMPSIDCHHDVTNWAPESGKLLCRYIDSNMRNASYRQVVFPGIKGVKIGKRITTPNPRNCYVFKVSFYSGDGDAAHTIHGTCTVGQLDEMINTLDHISRICDSNEIHKCISDWSEESQQLYYRCDNIIEWPSDVFTDGECASTFEAVESVVFYDGNGDKFECEIETL